MKYMYGIFVFSFQRNWNILETAHSFWIPIKSNQIRLICEKKTKTEWIISIDIDTFLVSAFSSNDRLENGDKMTEYLSAVPLLCQIIYLLVALATDWQVIGCWFRQNEDMLIFVASDFVRAHLSTTGYVPSRVIPNRDLSSALTAANVAQRRPYVGRSENVP